MTEIVSQMKFRFLVPMDNFFGYTTPEVTVNGIPWAIRLTWQYNFNNNANEMLATIMCNYKTQKADEKWCVEAEASLKLLAHGNGDYDRSVNITYPKSVYNKNEFFQAKSIISWNEIVQHTNRFVQMGKFKFEAEIKSHPVRFSQNEVRDFEFMSKRLFVEICKNKRQITEKNVLVGGITWLLHIDMCHSGDIAISVCPDSEIDWTAGWATKVNFNVKHISSDPDARPYEKYIKKRIFNAKTVLGWTHFMTLAELNEREKFPTDSLFFDVHIEAEPLQPMAELEPTMATTATSGDMTPRYKCPVCYEPFINQEVHATICGHVFCRACIREWVRLHRKCPLCNHPNQHSDLRIIYPNA